MKVEVESVNVKYRTVKFKDKYEPAKVNDGHAEVKDRPALINDKLTRVRDRQMKVKPAEIIGGPANVNGSPANVKVWELKFKNGPAKVERRFWHLPEKIYSVPPRHKCIHLTGTLRRTLLKVSVCDW